MSGRATARAARLRRSDALTRVGRVAEAREELLAYLAGAPDDWSAVEAAADLCERSGRLQDAARLRLGLARHFAREGAVARASETYEAVLRVAPADPCAAFRLAELVAAAGEHERARELLAGILPAGGGTPVVPAGRPADVCADLAGDRQERSRAGLVRLAAKTRGVPNEVTEAWLGAASRDPEAGVALALAVADACLVGGDAEAAIGALKAFLGHGGGEAAVAAWTRIVEVATEAGRGGVAIDAQAELAGALEAEGRLEEAERVARDLALRLPDAANQDRLARIAGARQAALQSPADTAILPVPAATGPAVGLVRDLSDALDELGLR